MTTLFTGKGDAGYTDLLVKGRVSKDEERVELLGTLDEASAAIGLARSVATEPHRGLLLASQRDLYTIMTEVSAAPDNTHALPTLGADRVAWLEAVVAELEAGLAVAREFIVPGDTLAGGALALARTVTRRAERRLVELHHKGMLANTAPLAYLNRLSSLLFTLELAENKAAGAPGSLARTYAPDQPPDGRDICALLREIDKPCQCGR